MKQAFDGEKQRRFLDRLAETGNVSEAAVAAGVVTSTAYTRRRSDPAFAAAWAAAWEDASERLLQARQDRLLAAAGPDLSGPEGADRWLLSRLDRRARGAKAGGGEARIDRAELEAEVAAIVRAKRG